MHTVGRIEFGPGGAVPLGGLIPKETLFTLPRNWRSALETFTPDLTNLVSVFWRRDLHEAASAKEFLTWLSGAGAGLSCAPFSEAAVDDLEFLEGIVIARLAELQGVGA